MLFLFLSEGTGGSGATGEQWMSPANGSRFRHAEEWHPALSERGPMAAFPPAQLKTPPMIFTPEKSVRHLYGARGW